MSPAGQKPIRESASQLLISFKTICQMVQFICLSHVLFYRFSIWVCFIFKMFRDLCSKAYNMALPLGILPSKSRCNQNMNIALHFHTSSENTFYSPMLRIVSPDKIHQGRPPHRISDFVW